MRGKFKKLIVFSTAALFSLILISILFFPAHLFVAILSLIQLPANLPLGISNEQKLEQNFQEQRSALETIVATVRANDLGTVGFDRWGLRGYTLPPAQDINYKNLYRSMRRARVQKVQVEVREPFSVQLITDETTAMIDIDVYGYVYTEGDRNDYFYGSHNRLDHDWYLFKDRY